MMFSHLSRSITGGQSTTLDVTRIMEKAVNSGVSGVRVDGLSSDVLSCMVGVNGNGQRPGRDLEVWQRRKKAIGKVPPPLGCGW